MVSHSNNRDPERHSVRLFWKWLTGDDITDIELDAMRNPNDPPDFRFFRDGRHVALEHTQVFRQEEQASPTPDPPLLPQHDHVIQQRIRGHVARLLKANSGEIQPLNISITFSSCHDVKMKQQEAAIAHDVLDLIRKRMDDGVALPIELYMIDLEHISSCLAGVHALPIDLCMTDLEHIGSCSPDVLVHMATKDDSSTASHDMFGQVDEWCLPHFQEAARKKDAGLARYQANFEQCWLLLSTGGSNPAQWLEPSPEACSTGIMTQFDRVFLVDERSRKVYEIHVERPDNAPP